MRMRLNIYLHFICIFLYILHPNVGVTIHICLKIKMFICKLNQAATLAHLFNKYNTPDTVD
jgi:hypothetical protein